MKELLADVVQWLLPARGWRKHPNSWQALQQSIRNYQCGAADIGE